MSDTPKTSAIAALAERCSFDPDKLLATLKATVFKKASNEELMALVAVSNAYGLNPLTKEIYAFPSKDGGIVPVVSVDGWIRMMNDHPQFDGIQFSDLHEDGKLVSVTCRIHRKDRGTPTEVTEHLVECRRNTDPWKMEHRMLRHKALIQCSRVAFGFSGIHDEDEARDITEKPVTAREIPPARIPMFSAPTTSETIEPGPEPTNREKLTAILATLNPDKVAAWLEAQPFPSPLEMSDAEVAEVLGMIDEVKGACR